MPDTPDITPKSTSSSSSSSAEPKRRRRRKPARLAIYQRLPDGLPQSANPAGLAHVVVDLSGGSEHAEVFTSDDRAQAEGFIEGAKWAGGAE